MRIEVTVDEAVALARAVRPLPPAVLAVRPAVGGDAVEADLDATLLPGASGLVRLAAAMAGTVTVTARLLGWSDGDAVVALAAEARGIAVHRLLNQFLGTIRSALAAQGLPPDLVELTAGPDGPRLVVHVQAAVDARASGVVVRDVTLTGGVVRAEVEVVPPVALR